MRQTGSADLVRIDASTGTHRVAVAERARGRQPDRTSFVGRAAELLALRGSVADHTLTTLTGPIGVGKSRLAHRGCSSWTGLFDEILLLDGRHDDTGSAVPALERLLLRSAGATRDRPILVCVDHVDDELDAVRDLVEAVLDEQPDTRVLHIGQQRLGIDGERLVALRPFETSPGLRERPLPDFVREDAVRLFLDRADALHPGFAIAEHERESMLQLIRSVGGLPLAIELAAERTRGLSVGDIARQLEIDLDLIRPSGASAATSTRSLESRIAAAMTRCSPDERRLLTACAAFGDEFDLDSLSDVSIRLGMHPGAVRGLVTSLVDRSILLPKRGTASTRLTLPPVIRRVIRDSDDPEVAGSASDAQADVAGRLTASVGSDWFGVDQDALFDRLRAESSNLRVAIGWTISKGSAEALRHALRMLRDLRFVWASSAESVFAREHLVTILSSGRLSPDDLVVALTVAAYFETRGGDLPVAATMLDRARAIERDTTLVGDDVGIVDLLRYDEGVLALVSGDRAEAAEIFSEVMRARTAGLAELSPAAGEAYFMSAWATLLRDGGDSPVAAGLVTDFIALAERTGDLWGQAYMMSVAVLMQLERGDAESALPSAIAALRVMDSLGDTTGSVLFVRIVGILESRLGRAQRAARLLAAPLPMTRLQSALLGDWTDIAEQQLAAAMNPRELARLADEVDRWTVGRTVALALDRPAPRTAGEATGPATAPGAESLSPRELEIAALVARGLSNIAIAGHLVISPRTVEGHVQKILQKLAFTSRTQVAAWHVQYLGPRAAGIPTTT